MLKRGQITTFMTIGFVILILVALFLTLRGRVSDIEEVVSPEMEPIKIFVEKCIEQTAENALLLVGVQGGYIYFDDNVQDIETFYSRTSNWYYLGQNLAPSDEFVALQISRYITEEINDRCLRNFEDFNQEFELGEITTKTVIAINEVLIDVEYPIILKQGNSESKVSKFSVILPVSLGAMLNAGRQIVQAEIADPDNIDLDFMANIGFHNAIYNYAEGVVLYSLTDDKSIVLDSPLKLIFSNTFEETGEDNQDPYFVEYENIIAIEGDRYNQTIIAYDADDDELTFSTFNPYFTVGGKTGVIDFVPDDNDIGEDFVTVTVSDGKGGYDYAQIQVIIVGINDNPPEIDQVETVKTTIDQHVEVELTATDEDGDEITFSIENSQNGMQIIDNKFSWTPKTEGKHFVTILANDGEYTSKMTFEIEVIRDRAPSIAFIGDRQAFAHNEFRFQVVAIDTDGDTLTYSDDTSLFNIDSSTGEIVFTPTEAGIHQITITVSDGILEDKEVMNLRII